MTKKIPYLQGQILNTKKCFKVKVELIKITSNYEFWSTTFMGFITHLRHQSTQSTQPLFFLKTEKLKLKSKRSYLDPEVCDCPLDRGTAAE